MRGIDGILFPSFFIIYSSFFYFSLCPFTPCLFSPSPLQYIRKATTDYVAWMWMARIGTDISNLNWGILLTTKWVCWTMLYFRKKKSLISDIVWYMHYICVLIWLKWILSNTALHVTYLAQAVLTPCQNLTTQMCTVDVKMFSVNLFCVTPTY